jgi:hypothetical protein
MLPWAIAPQLELGWLLRMLGAITRLSLVVLSCLISSMCRWCLVFGRGFWWDVESLRRLFMVLFEEQWLAGSWLVLLFSELYKSTSSSITVCRQLWAESWARRGKAIGNLASLVEIQCLLGYPYGKPPRRHSQYWPKEKINRGKMLTIHPDYQFVKKCEWVCTGNFLLILWLGSDMQMRWWSNSKLTKGISPRTWFLHLVAFSALGTAPSLACQERRVEWDQCVIGRLSRKGKPALPCSLVSLSLIRRPNSTFLKIVLPSWTGARSKLKLLLQPILATFITQYSVTRLRSDTSRCRNFYSFSYSHLPPISHQSIV